MTPVYYLLIFGVLFVLLWLIFYALIFAIRNKRLVVYDKKYLSGIFDLNSSEVKLNITQEKPFSFEKDVDFHKDLFNLDEFTKYFGIHLNEIKAFALNHQKNVDKNKKMMMLKSLNEALPISRFFSRNKPFLLSLISSYDNRVSFELTETFNLDEVNEKELQLDSSSDAFVNLFSRKVTHGEVFCFFIGFNFDLTKKRVFNEEMISSIERRFAEVLCRKLSKFGVWASYYQSNKRIKIVILEKSRFIKIASRNVISRIRRIERKYLNKIGEWEIGIGLRIGYAKKNLPFNYPQSSIVHLVNHAMVNSFESNRSSSIFNENPLANYFLKNIFQPLVASKEEIKTSKKYSFQMIPVYTSDRRKKLLVPHIEVPGKLELTSLSTVFETLVKYSISHELVTTMIEDLFKILVSSKEWVDEKIIIPIPIGYRNFYEKFRRIYFEDERLNQNLIASIQKIERSQIDDLLDEINWYKKMDMPFGVTTNHIGLLESILVNQEIHHLKFANFQSLIRLPDVERLIKINEIQTLNPDLLFIYENLSIKEHENSLQLFNISSFTGPLAKQIYEQSLQLEEEKKKKKKN